MLPPRVECRGEAPLRRKRARATTPPIGTLMHSPGKALSSAPDGTPLLGREGSEESTLAPAPVSGARHASPCAPSE